MSSFAERLKQARLASGLTQEELGFELDITKSSVSSWENERDFPNFKMLPKLKEVLECSLDYLVCGEVSEKSAATKGNDDRVQKPEENALLRQYRKLTPKQRKAILELMKST